MKVCADAAPAISTDNNYIP